MAEICFSSLGCDKNLVDSEVMIGLLKAKGHHIVDEDEQADVIIINTCSFIEDALSESIERVVEAGQYRNNGRLKGVIVTGCLPQRYQHDFFEQLPEVSAIVGSASYDRICEVVDSVLAGINGKKIMDSIDRMLPEEVSAQRELSVLGHHYAYLKIAEGCDNHCTYCIIPQIRGKYRSREMQSLIAEAKLLAGQGVKELILVAQDTSVYGRDLYHETKLVPLIESLSAISGIEWIRLLYCYPENIDDALIEQFKTNSKLCNYIDMPIQHASDAVLRRMGRRTTAQSVAQTIEKLRKAVPDMVIRTSLITGFPGESEEDFIILKQFVEKIKFERLGVFAYSREEGTPSYKMDGQLPEKIKKARRDEIMAMQRTISQKIGETVIGRQLEVMVEGSIAAQDLLVCRSFRDAPDVDTVVFVEMERSSFVAGDFINVVVTGCHEYDLLAREVEVLNEFSE